jgi:hypothetical protein
MLPFVAKDPYKVRVCQGIIVLMGRMGICYTPLHFYKTRQGFLVFQNPEPE